MAKSSYLPEYSDDEFLRHLAQNDYMIDQYFTRAGARILEIADKIESFNKRMSNAMEIMDNEMEHWRKNQNQD